MKGFESQIKDFDNQLEDIVDLIHGETLNYVADVVLYPPVSIVSKSIDEIVKAVLGPEAVIRNTSPSNAQDVQEELKYALSYAGYESSHPCKEYVGSEAQKQHLVELSNKLELFLSRAAKITSFNLSSGHPFYPVFWDFAFIIEVADKAYIFIGSSSD